MRVNFIGKWRCNPAHGVGIVQAIESKVLERKKESFYILRILDTGIPS